MVIKNILSGFLKDDQAAVTVDWVVLTAALVTMAILVVSLIDLSLTSAATAISTGIISEVADAFT